MGHGDCDRVLREHDEHDRANVRQSAGALPLLHSSCALLASVLLDDALGHTCTHLVGSDILPRDYDHIHNGGHSSNRVQCSRVQPDGTFRFDLLEYPHGVFTIIAINLARTCILNL